ncbi:hypothetical protein [Gordonia sihwensis]|uniref:hypothetical protein n=1 Tax=Gordonia sihwensis TaxID=173559 RepID=UPI003D97F0E7
MMNTEITVATDGPDDAEATARTLEQLAATIRSAGGAPVIDDGESVHVDFNGGLSQTTNWRISATA